MIPTHFVDRMSKTLSGWLEGEGMRTTVEVADSEEASLIRGGLGDPEILAFVKIVAVLRGLPSDRARGRVLRYVEDIVAEQLERE